MACAFRRSASLFCCRKRIYFWRRRGGQNSGALVRRENDFVCVGERDSPLPAARGEHRRPPAAVLDGRTPMRSIGYGSEATEGEGAHPRF
jgi:hypothetical protein